MVKYKLETQRLLLDKLSFQNAEFIQELVNTPGWLQYIGERNIKSPADAIAYIQKINSTPHLAYWVIYLKETQQPLGLVTFMKRNYLEHYDIGFALLPQYGKKGYAFEAAKKVMDAVSKDKLHKNILGITIPGNKNSIQLLEKLGLQFRKEIKVADEMLLVYARVLPKR